VIGLPLVIQVPDASDMGDLAVIFRPIDRFPLCLEVAERMVCVVFNDIIVDMASLGTTLGARFNVNVRHVFLSWVDNRGQSSSRFFQNAIGYAYRLLFGLSASNGPKT